MAVRITSPTDKAVRLKGNLSPRSFGKLVMSSLDRAQLLTVSDRQAVCYVLQTDRYSHFAVQVNPESIEATFFDYDEVPRWSKTVRADKDKIKMVMNYMHESAYDSSDR